MSDQQLKGDAMTVSTMFSQLRNMLIDLQREHPDAMFNFLDAESDLKEHEEQFDSWAIEEDLL